MVLYFLGTGNSFYVANDIAAAQNEELISISKEMNLNKELYMEKVLLKRKIYKSIYNIR